MKAYEIGIKPMLGLDERPTTNYNPISMGGQRREESESTMNHNLQV